MACHVVVVAAARCERRTKEFHLGSLVRRCNGVTGSRLMAKVLPVATSALAPTSASAVDAEVALDRSAKESARMPRSSPRPGLDRRVS